MRVDLSVIGRLQTPQTLAVLDAYKGRGESFSGRPAFFYVLADFSRPVPTTYSYRLRHWGRRAKKVMPAAGNQSLPGLIWDSES